MGVRGGEHLITAPLNPFPGSGAATGPGRRRGAKGCTRGLEMPLEQSTAATRGGEMGWGGITQPQLKARRGPTQLPPSAPAVAMWVCKCTVQVWEVLGEPSRHTCASQVPVASLIPY